MADSAEPRHKAQCAEMPRSDAPLSQGAPRVAQRSERQQAFAASLAASRSGLPNPLKAGLESLSGFSMDDVRVHYDSSRPAQLKARAYAQGNDIYLAPGQESHLAHEAWHVVQQKQGRVTGGRRDQGLAINDDPALEREADRMGSRAIGGGASSAPLRSSTRGGVVQRLAGIEYETALQARKPVPAESGLADDDDSLRVPQDVVMAASNGWEAVSDNSAIEFVTTPAVAIATLRNVVGDFVGRLNGVPTPLNAASDFQAVLGVAPKAPYRILPYPHPAVTGQIQGTIGIDFEKLPAFFDLVTRHNLASNQRRQQVLNAQWPNPTPEQTQKLQLLAANPNVVRSTKAAKIGTIITLVDQKTAAIKAEMSQIVDVPGKDKRHLEQEKLRGLLILVGQYIVFSEDYRSSYAKKMFPIMARTSFQSMYKGLTKAQRKHFLPIARALVTDLGRQLDERAFGDEADRLGEDARFTLGEWLDSIVKGSVRHIPGKKPDDPGKNMVADRMTAPGIAANPTDASMGAMRLDQGKVVVELRGIVGHHTPQSLGDFVDDLATFESQAPRAR